MRLNYFDGGATCFLEWLVFVKCRWKAVVALLVSCAAKPTCGIPSMYSWCYRYFADFWWLVFDEIGLTGIVWAATALRACLLSLQL